MPTRFIRPGHCIESPGFLPRVDVVRLDEAANAEFCARHADDHFVFHDQRRNGDRIAVLVVCEFDIPDRRSGLCVECDQVGIACSKEQLVAVDGSTAVVWSATATEVAWYVLAILPNLPSRSRVNGPHVPAKASHINHVVDENRRRLEIWTDTCLERPLRLELVDVLRRDLRQRAVTMPKVVPVIDEPLRTIVLKAGK